MAVDLSNPTLWELIVDVSLAKTTGDIDYPYPLIYLNKYVKAIATTNISAHLYAGRLSLMIGSFTDPEPIYATQGNMLFNSMRLFQWDLLEQASSSQFHCVYTPPYWVQQVNLKIYQYQPTL